MHTSMTVVTLLVAAAITLSSAQFIPPAPQGDLIEIVLTSGDRFAVQRVVACRLQDAVASPAPLASRLVRLQATLPILANASFVVVPASTLRQLPQKAPLDGRLLTLCKFDGSIDVRDSVVLLDVLDSPPTPCSLQDEFGDTVPLLVTSLLASGAKAVLITTIASVGYSARFTSAQYYSTLLVRSYGVSLNMLEAPLFKMLKKDFATLKTQATPARLVSLGGTTSIQSVDVNNILGIPLVCLATLSCFLAPIFGALITSFGVILFVIILTSNAKTTTVQLAFGACSLSYGWCVLVSGATACDNYTIDVMWTSLILDSLALFFFVLSILLIAHMWASTIAPTLVDTSALKPWMLTGAFWALFGVDVVACILLCVRSLLRSPLAGRAVALALVALVSSALVISGAVFVHKFSRTDANERYRRVIRFTTALLIAFSVQIGRASCRERV